MTIQGLQKLTLLDFPGRVACTVFLGGCNFRCPFCHNASLVTGGADGAMDEEALFAFLDTRRGRLDGVCITGGEPTLRRDLPDLIAGIRARGFAVKLDTNGTDPAMLDRLIADGWLDYVAMDIKNAPDKYGATAGITGGVPDTVQASIDRLMRQDVPFEFRTTAVREWHTPEDFAAIGRWIAGAPRYFIQQFTDSGDVIGTGLTAPTPQEMQAFLAAVKPYIPAAKIRGV